MTKLQQIPACLTAILFTCLLSFILTAKAYGVIVDRIAAVVNGDVITLSELKERARPLIEKYIPSDMSREERAAKEKEILKQVVTQMIDEDLAQAEIKKLGIKVSDEEVDEAIASLCKENNLTMDEFKAKLASNGISLNDYKKDIKKQIENSQLIGSQVHAKTVVTDEEVLAYLKKEAGQNPGEEGPFYVLQHIYIAPKTPGDPNSRQEALNKAKEAIAALKDRQKFDKVAKEYSYPPLGQAGSYLGTFAEKDLSRTIKDAVTRLKPGQFTDVMDTPDGFQIIRLKAVNKTQAEQPLDLSKIDRATMEEARKKLLREKLNARFEEWLRDLRSKATIRIML